MRWWAWRVYKRLAEEKAFQVRPTFCELVNLEPEDWADKIEYYNITAIRHRGAYPPTASFDGPCTPSPCLPTAALLPQPSGGGGAFSSTASPAARDIMNYRQGWLDGDVVESRCDIQDGSELEDCAYQNALSEATAECSFQALVDPTELFPITFFQKFIGMLAADAALLVSPICFHEVVVLSGIVVPSSFDGVRKALLNRLVTRHFFSYLVKDNVNGDGFFAVWLEAGCLTLYDGIGRQLSETGKWSLAGLVPDQDLLVHDRGQLPTGLPTSLTVEHVAFQMYNKVFVEHRTKGIPKNDRMERLDAVLCWRFRVYMHSMVSAVGVINARVPLCDKRKSSAGLPEAFAAAGKEVRKPWWIPCVGWCGSVVNGIDGGGYTVVPSGCGATSGDGLTATRTWHQGDKLDVYGCRRRCDRCFVDMFGEIRQECMVCRLDTTADFTVNVVLLCDGCDGEVHLACSELDHDPDPDGEWFCSECLQLPTLQRKGRRHHAAYVMDADVKSDGFDTVWLDATEQLLEFGLMCKINSIRGASGRIMPGRTANVEFVTNGMSISVVCIRQVNEGEEFLADYRWRRDGQCCKKA